MQDAFHVTVWDLQTGSVTETWPRGLVLALGNFDGVHRGHAALLAEAGRLAADQGTAVGVWYFSIASWDRVWGQTHTHLCDEAQKRDYLQKAGARYAFVADFAAWQRQTPADFVAFLRDVCECQTVVCGFNFRFGKDAAGDAAFLQDSFGARCHVTDAVTADGEVISSSRIRRLLAAGDVTEAGRLLGHPFAVRGEVVHGKALGRRLGLPTANQFVSDALLMPAQGVYVSSCRLDGHRYTAVTNIGVCPTVKQGGAVCHCETHLLSYEGSLYGTPLTVFLHARLREEKQFASQEALREAMRQDVEAARRYETEYQKTEEC